MQPHRSRTRSERARDDGVWTASLFLVFVSFLMPVWFFGAAAALATGSGAPAFPHTTLIVLIAIGAVAIWFAVHVALTLARAPRLGRGYHRWAMRRLSMFAAPLAILFLLWFSYRFDGLLGIAMGYIGAVAPAFLVAELSFALPAISKHRYGADIGGLGGCFWLGAAACLLLTSAFGFPWWTPAAVAGVAACCTAIGASRIWHHYEGDIIHS